MPDIKIVFNEEVRRLAKKEVKAATAPLFKVLAEQRKTISELKKRVAVLEKAGEKNVPADNPVAAAEQEVKLRLNAAGISRIRNKLELTQSDFAKLLGVSTHTVSIWEQDKSSPRKDAKAAICALRTIGKRELKKRLEALDAAEAE